MSEMRPDLIDPRRWDMSGGRDILPNARYVRDAAAGAAREFQRALPELVTNADAAIGRTRPDGRIWIYINTREPQTVQVVDDGIGMDARRMEHRLFTLGVNPEAEGERSLFGRGLRDVLMSAVAGEVASVAADGRFYHALFRMPPNSFLKSVWADDHDQVANASLLAQFRLPTEGTGTSVKIWLDAQHSRLPAADRLFHVVRSLVQCRPIYDDPNRSVYLSIDGGPLVLVTYDRPAIAATLVDEILAVEGFPEAQAHVVVHRSTEEFPLTRIERHIRRGGLLIRSGRAAHAATYFEFEGWEGTRRLFGSVTCDAIDVIQRSALDRGESEAIVFSDRSGLNPDHPFTRALHKVVNERLQPIVESEEGGRAPTRPMADSVRSRRERGLRELNRMASKILRSLGKGVGGRGRGRSSSPTPLPSQGQPSGPTATPAPPPPALPAAVFFPQPVYFLKAGAKRTIIALVDPARVLQGADVEVILEDDTAGRVVYDPKLPPTKAPIQRVRIGITGGDPRARSTLLLRVGAETAETEIIVQSHKARGIFSDIKPIDQDNPYMQARFNASTGVVEVFTGRPEFASLVRAGERAMGKLHALDYPPYEVKEIDAALTVVYQFLAERDQARLPENHGISPQVLQARILNRIEELRYEWDGRLMKAFLSDATYEGRVRVAADQGGKAAARARTRRSGARVSAGAAHR
jgi:Histidine kinase-, DNA gyrase B-, and HSP90-like ATPase